MREVALTKVVARAPPLTSITEVGVKPVPVKLRAGAVVAPASTDIGINELITGKGFTMGYGNILDVPPFGGAGGGAAGFVTASDTVPAVAMSAVVSVT
jgi:hypothetical protein